MKKYILIILVLLISIKVSACTCECNRDCSFKAISNGQNFVALVKVIEYTDFLDDEIYGYEGKMPLSMTVEIVKKFKGPESRKQIKIWGDNGMLCRPYIAHFKVGKYYLIAPTVIDFDSEAGNENDYDFFACWTDYLEVDYENQIAHGSYSRWRKEISLAKFERKLKK